MTVKRDFSLIIGHDLDGNIADWHKAVVMEFSKKYGFDPETPVTQWDMWKDWGLSDEEFGVTYSELVNKGILQDLEVMTGEIDFLLECSLRGHKNYIITNRQLPYLSNKATADTYVWVANNLCGATIDAVIVSANKNAVHTDIYFDDSSNNIRDIWENGSAAGYLVNRSYNESDTDLDPVRIYSVGEKYLALDAAEKIVIGEEVWDGLYDTGLGRDVESVRAQAIQSKANADEAEARLLDNHYGR